MQIANESKPAGQHTDATPQLDAAHAIATLHARVRNTHMILGLGGGGQPGPAIWVGGLRYVVAVVAATAVPLHLLRLTPAAPPPHACVRPPADPAVHPIPFHPARASCVTPQREHARRSALPAGATEVRGAIASRSGREQAGH